MEQLMHEEIRAPRWDDFSQLLALARRHHAELGNPQFPFEEDRAARLFIAAMMNRDRCGCLVAIRGGLLVGAIVGGLTTDIFCASTSVVDIFHYVVPEHRRGRIAYRLWKALLEWSENAGAVEITHGVATTSRSADDFFRDAGLTLVGGVFKTRLYRG